MNSRKLSLWLILILILLMAISPVQADGDLLNASDDTCNGVNIHFQLDEAEDPERTFSIQVYDGKNIYLATTVFKGGVGEHHVYIPYSRLPETSTVTVSISHREPGFDPDSLFQFQTHCLNNTASEANEIAAGVVRVVANIDFVVFYHPEGYLTYYEVINSQGIPIGGTSIGWRNDSLSNILVHTVTRSDGVQARLWNLGGGVYKAELIKNGQVVSQGQFYGAGPSGSGVAGSSGGVEVQSQPQVQPITVESNRAIPFLELPYFSSGDTGVRSGARGTFDGTYYRVAYGDTFIGICYRFRVHILAMIYGNDLDGPHDLHTGDVLRIPQ